MACLFGHKWKGCKCEKCGKLREEGHNFQSVDGKCTKKCTICGKTTPMNHMWKGARCQRCGEMRTASSVQMVVGVFTGKIQQTLQNDGINFTACASECSRYLGKIKAIMHEYGGSIYTGQSFQEFLAGQKSAIGTEFATLASLGKHALYTTAAALYPADLARYVAQAEVDSTRFSKDFCQAEITKLVEQFYLSHVPNAKKMTDAEFLLLPHDVPDSVFS